MAKENLKLYGVRLDRSLRNRVAILAEQDQRTFSNYVAKILSDHVEAMKAKRRPNGAHKHDEIAA